jgi:hypothetical protein
MKAVDAQAPATPHGITELPREQVQQGLLDGRLLSLLRSDASCRQLGDVLHVRLAGEKHRRDSSALILELTVSSAGAATPCSYELVLLYARRPEAGESVSAWWYPRDPWLAALEHVVGNLPSLTNAAWERPWPREYGWDASVATRRLSYYPAQRASFLLSAPSWPGNLVLKLVRRSTFAGCLNIAEQLEQIGLGERVALPRLLASSASQSALVYEHLPGSSLDRLDRTTRRGLASEAGDVLAEIHCAPAPALPRWDPVAELTQTRLLVSALRQSCPAAAADIEPSFERLADRLTRPRPSHRHLVHNDFSFKNLLWQADGTSDEARGRLAVLDWDRAVLGPIERDLASVLSGLGGDAPRTSAWLASYQSRTGHQVDFALVEDLMKHQRLLKLGRRILKEVRPSESTLESLRTLTDGRC